MVDDAIERYIENIDMDSINRSLAQIPFGNSDFQNEHFVVDGNLTPGRKLRACGLRLRDRVNALREAYDTLQLDNVDIAEMKEKAQNEPDKYERQRIGIRLAKKLAERADTKKLVRDAITEVNGLLRIWQSLPHDMTREQFEAEEQTYFEQSLQLQAIGITGPLKSLLDIGKGQVVMFQQGGLHILVCPQQFPRCLFRV